MTLASFGTIERYYARILPTYNKRYFKNKWSDPNKFFFRNDQNFISDPVIAKYLISYWPSPEHYIDELPYRAILFGFYLVILLNLCVI